MGLIIQPGSKPVRQHRVDDVYFAYPNALSRSMIKTYRDSDGTLAGVRDCWINPKKYSAKKSRSLLIGCAFENLVLDTERYKKDFRLTLFEDWNKHRKELKAMREGGVEPIKRSEHDKLILMRDNLLRFPLAPLQKYGIRTVGDLLERGFETQVMKVFQVEGVICKALVDIYLKLPDGKTFICDLKTSRLIRDIHTFFFDATKYGYDLQSVFYPMAFQNEDVLPYFPFLVGNTNVPRRAGVYWFSDSYIQTIEAEVLKLIRLHKAMLDGNIE